MAADSSRKLVSNELEHLGIPWGEKDLPVLILVLLRQTRSARVWLNSQTVYLYWS